MACKKNIFNIKFVYKYSFFDTCINKIYIYIFFSKENNNCFFHCDFEFHSWSIYNIHIVNFYSFVHKCDKITCIESLLKLISMVLKYTF